MRQSRVAVFVGLVSVALGVVGLAVHVDGFVDSRMIGSPLARSALGPLGVVDIEGAIEQSLEGTEAGQWLVGVLQASGDGELSVAYSLIDVGAESLARQLTVANKGSHVPLLYLLKGYMYALVTPWWAFALLTGGGAWLRTWGRTSPSRYG